MSTIDGQQLSVNHRAELTASAISEDVIAARGYETIISGKALPPAFTGNQRKLHGWMVPIRDVTGEIVAWQLKPDEPRIDASGRIIKYETAGRSCIDVPLSVLPYLRNPDADLWITEGCKKVDAALSNGIPCVIGLLGVDGWSSQGVALPDWKEIALRGRTVILAFDSDVMTKDSVRGALVRLAKYLEMQQAIARYLVMPDLAGGTKCGIDDFLAAFGTRLDLEERYLFDTLPGSEIDWQPPIPFDDPHGPPVPIHILPEKLREYALAVAEDTGAPIDLVAWCALAIIGAATRGRYVVSPKPTWREPIHIQSLQVLASGGGKSPAYDAITTPLKIWDIQRTAKGREALGLWKLKGKSLTAAEKQAQREADKFGSGQQDKQLALEAIQRDIIRHEDEKPYAQHIIVNDITPQAIWKFLYRQQGSGAGIHPEGGFLRNISRYSELPVFDPVLEGFSGDGHDLRRAGDEDDEGKVIPRSIFAISLAVQPQVLEDMGQLRGFKELGVSARLITTFPRPVPERDDLSVSVPGDLQRWWTDRVLEIANGTDGTTYNPKTLPMSPDALEAFREEYAWYPKAVTEGVFLDMEEWGRKYRGQVLRIAGILHVLEEPEPVKTPISAENMRRAITIMRNAIDHARIGHGIMLGLGTQSNERYVLNVIDTLLESNPDATVTSADVYDRVRGRYIFRKADRVISILQTLEGHRYIRMVRREGPGPRSYTIIRNPMRGTCEDAKLPPDSAGSDPDTGHDQVISHFRSPSITLEKPVPTPIRPEPLRPTGTEGADDEWEF